MTYNMTMHYLEQSKLKRVSRRPPFSDCRYHVAASARADHVFLV